ncbi:MAG: DUF2927 domain-containing protein [Alphaproteobacteria bacterium]
MTPLGVRASVLLAAVALAAGLVAGAPARAADPDPQDLPSVDVLVRQFENIAFSAEYLGEHRRGRLIKWTGPIRIRILGSYAQRFRPEVQAQIDLLVALSGLSIQIVDGAATQRANVDINFSPRGRYWSLEPEAPCRTIFFDRSYAIERVEVFINPDDLDLRRHCVVEELTQALGLSDDSTLIPDSIFSDESQRDTLAPWDEIMVRVLYDPRLRPGMTKQEAMPVVARILWEMLGLNPSGTTSSRPRRR